MRWPRAWRERLLGALVVLAPAALSGALRVLARTLRIEYQNADALFDLWARRERVIIAFWHNRSVLMPVPYRGEKMCIMNSQHRDGEIATRALARWGIHSVRGSATRGGIGGFRQLVRAYRDGYDLAVVPDGPRGPRYVAKPGVIHLAKATGAPIFPVSYAASRARRLRSWDQLIIPLPFARVVFAVGVPITVARDADDATVEALREALETSLSALGDQAERLLAT
jgi:hypothetical protein